MCYAPPAMNFWAETMAGALKGVLLMVFVFIPVGLLALYLIAGGIWVVFSAASVATTWALEFIGVPRSDTDIVIATVVVAFFVYLAALALSRDISRL